MKFYKEEGNIEGFSQMIFGKYSTYAMFFFVKTQLTFELHVSHVTTIVKDSGITEKNVKEWLWEKGKEMILNKAIDQPTRIILMDMDISHGNIITHFDNLQNEPL